MCFQAQSPLPEKPDLILLLDEDTSLQRPELPSPSQKNPNKNKIGKQIKNGVSLIKRLFSHKNRIFSLEKGMLPFLIGRGIEKISASYICISFFIIIIIYNPSPLLKIPNRIPAKTPFQARTTSSLFFFSCRFLLTLVVLFTVRTKPIREPK